VTLPLKLPASSNYCISVPMTRRMSVRAQAREIYRERIAAEAQKKTPALTLPRIRLHAAGCGGQARGREKAKSGAGECAATAPAAPPPKLSRLTQRVRKLYEETAVPVAEIAAIAGVTERTLYKYARKGGWTPRYAWIGRGGLAHRRWRARSRFAPIKGAGARFVKRKEKGRPFARGLKATDRVGGARAAAACAFAEARGRQAQAEASWMLWNETFLDWLKLAAELEASLAAHRARRRQRANGAGGAPDAHAQWLDRAGQAACECLELCQAHQARCGSVAWPERAACTPPARGRAA
jgi:hypothetical protein